MNKLTRKTLNVFQDLRSSATNVDRFLNLSLAMYKIASEVSVTSFQYSVNNKNEYYPYANFSRDDANDLIIDQLESVRISQLEKNTNIHVLRLIASSRLLYLLLNGVKEFSQTGESSINIVNKLAITGTPEYLNYNSYSVLEPVFRGITEMMRIDILHIRSLS